MRMRHTVLRLRYAFCRAIHSQFVPCRSVLFCFAFFCIVLVVYCTSSSDRCTIVSSWEMSARLKKKWECVMWLRVEQNRVPYRNPFFWLYCTTVLYSIDGGMNNSDFLSRFERSFLHYFVLTIRIRYCTRYCTVLLYITWYFISVSVNLLRGMAIASDRIGSHRNGW